ncbi:hypothetical protein M404DRAFT_11371 [Pisolithus tinctorius Marx 270]|uniref:Uncharacterized protein n=1 Tax=Pisolithus tinctorius Marx 270 TaxID=870435 RepID=A0A0C3NDZ7_PISTI|nr:hypothetical protein M404DRAFT_11371 [Pisolithus tinctorius Marx 270]
MYTLIENFCLGTRRLEIFGRARSSLRRGWVTVLAEGEEERVQELIRERAVCVPENVRRWEKENWDETVKQLTSIGGGKCVVPNTSEIETLRPKSPVRAGVMPGGGGVSGGVGVAISGGVALSVPGAGRNGRPPIVAPNQAPASQLAVPPMMGPMGMGNMPMGVGMPVEMGGWPGMGVNMNMAGMGMGMGNMNMSMMGVNMDGMAGAPMWVGPEAAEGGMWEGGMGDGMMMNGMGMAMGGMGMNMGNVGVGNMMGSMNGMAQTVTVDLDDRGPPDVRTSSLWKPPITCHATANKS